MHHHSGTVYLIPINMSAININAGFTKNMGQLIRSKEREIRFYLKKKKKKKNSSKTSSLFYVLSRSVRYTR